MKIQKLTAKWSGLSLAKKASLAVIFSQFCQKGLAMLTAPIFTRIMTTDQYGVITNYNSWQNVILILATLNLSQGVFNNGMLEFPEDRERFTASALALSNLCTLILFALYYVFRPVLQPIIGLSDTLMVLMLLHMLFYPAFTYWSCRQRYEFKYKLLTVLTILISIFQVGLSLIAVLLTEGDRQPAAKVFGTELALILVGMVLSVYLLVRSRFKISGKYMAYAFKFNIFLIPHFLAMSVLSSGDRIMIRNMVGESATAIYGVSYTIAAVISILGQAIELSWAPWLFEHLKVNDKKAIANRGSQIVIIYAVVSLTCMLLAPEVMLVLGSAQYREGMYIIPSVTAGVFASSVYALYVRLEYYAKKTKATMFGSIAVAALNMVLNYIFIKLYGYIAAGYTTLVCYFLLYLFHFFYSRRIGMKSIYKDKQIFFISLLVIAASVLVSFTYTIPVLRFALLGAVALLLVVFRKKVFALIKAIIK